MPLISITRPEYSDINELATIATDSPIVVGCGLEPVYFRQLLLTKRGSRKKNMMTLYEKFKSLQDAEKYLKEGVTFKRLDDIAKAMTDNEAASLLQEQRTLLFKTIHEDNPKCA